LIPQEKYWHKIHTNLALPSMTLYLEQKSVIVRVRPVLFLNSVRYGIAAPQSALYRGKHGSSLPVPGKR
jgi:hypothetical protein